MKRFFLLCCVVCLAVSSYARYDVIYLCQGGTYSWDLSEYCTPGDTLVYLSGSNDWTIFYQEAQYDTVLGNQVILSPSADRAYKLISINGSDTVIGDCPVYLTIYIKTAPTISIDSIKHVTCPDGLYYPYMDGSFHVSLNDSIQNYAWINIQVDTPFFFGHTCYDNATLSGLESGTYHIFSYGINGCEFHDSVIIEQPDPWIDIYDSLYTDTVCAGQPGCLSISIYGGTPPYNFTWFYFSDTGQVFMDDSTRLICDVYSGYIYGVYMHDAKGCKALGTEMNYIFTYLYEYVEDSTHLLAVDPLVCYGSEPLIQAQSIGVGTYTWHVGDLVDSINYWTGIYGDSMFVAEYFTPPMTESTWISVDFSDQHGCVTHDSVWVDVYNSNISMIIQTTDIVTDSTCTVQVSPPGGNLYMDDNLITSNIPSNYTFSTAGISVGEHVLKYAGIFGAEVGLACEDEISIPIQVEINPLVPDWEYDISIYPNPAITILNLISTKISDFELSILDITGKVIKTGKMLDQTFTFDVSDLASGVYMLRLVSRDGASKIVKFVKR